MTNKHRKILRSFVMKQDQETEKTTISSKQKRRIQTQPSHQVQGSTLAGELAAPQSQLSVHNLVSFQVYDHALSRSTGLTIKDRRIVGVPQVIVRQEIVVIIPKIVACDNISVLLPGGLRVLV